MKPVKIIATLAIAALPACASDLITKSSPHSVGDTADNLVAAVEGAGAKVFARVDHAAGAANIGSSLRPTQMVMFGNPKLGTPALQAAQTAGLDLPLRVVIYEDASGQTMVTYHDPASLARDHGIPGNAEVLTKMTGALNNLTNAAIAP